MIMDTVVPLMCFMLHYFAQDSNNQIKGNSTHIAVSRTVK